jgi:mannan endo-1,6-alpha-mannosidase
MSLYKNNATGIAAEEIGIWPQPHYWWEGGAAWGGMIEYSQFTDDASYVETLQEALTANYGPANDFILSYRKSQTVREFLRPCGDPELTKNTGQR